MTLKLSILAGCVAAGLGALASAEAAPTIVGEWAEKPGDCGTQWSWHVGPKTLQNHTFSCEFASVARAGSTVTWTGTCENGEMGTVERASVKATDSAKGLTLRWSGGDFVGPLKSCKAR